MAVWVQVPLPGPFFERKAKLEQFPKDKTLVVLNKESIKPYLDYAINKYGKDFI